MVELIEFPFYLIPCIPTHNFFPSSLERRLREADVFRSDSEKRVKLQVDNWIIYSFRIFMLELIILRLPNKQ